MIIFKAFKWSIQLEENWESEISEEYYSFYSPEGYGALQISDYTKSISITYDDILDLVGFNDDEKSRLEVVKFGDFEGFQLVYINKKNTFWRKLWLKNDKLLLFITYNCNSNYKDYEVESINEILLSLKVILN